MACASSSNDTGKKVTDMFPTIAELDQAQGRYEEYAVHAVRSRKSTTTISTLRRAVGARFIALGRRIAATDPVLELARSR